MGTTPIYALPYPEAVDPADVPLDMRELAERVEAVLSSRQLAYAEFTTTVGVAVYSEATAITVVAAGAVTYQAQPIMIEFFAPSSNPGTTWIRIGIFDGTTALGFTHIQGAGVQRAASIARRLTPAAGSHDYNVKAWVDAGGGFVLGGPGGAGNYVPGFIRVTRAA